MPAAEDDENLEPLVEEFNSRRDGSTNPALVARLLTPIRRHYAPLIQRTWDLLWSCRDREAKYTEAPSVRRRWEEDRQAYTNHLDWTIRVGHRRTRQTPRQAAMLMRRLEQAAALFDAEKACDDPLLIISELMEGKAIKGRVLRVDESYRETVNVRPVSRSLVTISSSEPCVMPRGKELWWTSLPGAAPYVIVDVRARPRAGSLITLKLTTSSRIQLPQVGDEACFSIHTTRTYWLASLPPSVPWTHRQSDPTSPTEIEGN